MIYNMRFAEIKGLNYIRFSPGIGANYFKNGLEIKRVLSTGTVIYFSYRDNVRYWHREDGPAVIHSDGRKDFYYWGQKLNCETQEQFEKIIKLKEFL